MDKEYVMHIAQTIKEQLLSFTPIPVFMSWGVANLSLRYSKNYRTAAESKRTVTRRICRYRSQRL